MLEKIKNVVKNPLFLSAVAGGAGFLLMFQGNIMYAGIGFGVGICKFLDAFK